MSCGESCHTVPRGDSEAHVAPPDVYRVLCDLRKEDGDRFWTLFRFMGTANAVGVVLIGSAPDALRLFIASLGLVIAFAWLMAQLRLGFWVRAREKHLQRFECRYAFPFQIFRERDFLPKPGGPVCQGLSARKCGYVVAAAFLVLWVGLVLYYGLMLVR